MLKIPESSMKVKIKKIKKLQDDVRFNSGGDAPPGRKSQVQQQDAAQGMALPMTSKGGERHHMHPFSLPMMIFFSTSSGGSCCHDPSKHSLMHLVATEEARSA